MKPPGFPLVAFLGVFFSCTPEDAGLDEQCNLQDDDHDGAVDERGALLVPDCLGDPETPVDMGELQRRDPWVDLDSADVSCGSFVVGLWTDFEWDCVLYYRAHVYDLDPDLLCEGCTYGFFIEAELEEGVARDFGYRECDEGDFLAWATPEGFSTVWGFSEPEGYDSYSWYYGENAWYYSFADEGWVPMSGVYFSDSYRDPYSSWEFLVRERADSTYEVGSFGL